MFIILKNRSLNNDTFAKIKNKQINCRNKFYK